MGRKCVLFDLCQRNPRSLSLLSLSLLLQLALSRLLSSIRGCQIYFRIARLPIGLRPKLPGCQVCSSSSRLYPGAEKRTGVQDEEEEEEGEEEGWEARGGATLSLNFMRDLIRQIGLMMSLLSN